VAQVDIAEIDRDFFGLGRLRPQFVDIRGHFSIVTPSARMFMDVLRCFTMPGGDRDQGRPSEPYGSFRWQSCPTVPSRADGLEGVKNLSNGNAIVGGCSPACVQGTWRDGLPLGKRPSVASQAEKTVFLQPEGT
jgi:hypothetical protein